MTRAASAALSLLALSALPGCRDTTVAPEQSGPVAVAPPPSASAVPVDHLAPGELVEGGEVAFGVRLPQKVTIERSAPDSVRASGPVALHPFVKYLQARLKGARVEEGDTYATFDHVSLPAKPGGDYRFKLTVMPSFRTLLEVDDFTPRPVPSLPNDVERWKAVGMTPEGKVLDPTHLE